MSDLTPVIWITAIVWLVAQTSKFLIAKLRGQEIEFMATGGMPSGHAAFIGAATTVIGLRDGIDSSVFGLAVVLLLIVIHDAVRLRWAVGQQAERINELVLREGLGRKETVVVWHGHRIREVAAGLAIGGLLSWLIYRLAY